MPQRSSPFDPYLPQFGCLLLVLALAAVCLMPLVMLRVMEDALRHLHLPGWLATLTIVGILAGSLINIPLYRIDRDSEQPVMRGYMVPGLGWVPMPRKSAQSIIAVNVGGCIIPALLALLQASYVITDMPQARWALLVATGVNIAVCYYLARPIPGVGIAIPAFVPPLAAIGLAWLLLNGEQFNEVRAGRLRGGRGRPADRGRPSQPAAVRRAAHRHSLDRRRGHLRRHRHLRHPGRVLHVTLRREPSGTWNGPTWSRVWSRLEAQLLGPLVGQVQTRVFSQIPSQLFACQRLAARRPQAHN